MTDSARLPRAIDADIKHGLHGSRVVQPLRHLHIVRRQDIRSRAIRQRYWQ